MASASVEPVTRISVPVSSEPSSRSSTKVCAALRSASFGDDAAGVQVILQRMALAQKLGGKDDLELGIFGAYILGVTNGNGGLDNHDGARVELLD